MELMDMPGLPITGLFSRKTETDLHGGIDQKVLWCPRCGHGQLYQQVDPAILYDEKKYSFKTSASSTARQGTQSFVSFLKAVSGERKFNCALDVGCNDLYLLNELKSLSKQRVGIDPIWLSRKPDNMDRSIDLIGGTIEEIDLAKALPCKPDLILCRHTLEHIFDPRLVLEKLIDFSAEDAIFLFEMPGFDSLVARGRFDQIFHEHLQYFSRSSFSGLVQRCGAVVTGCFENYHDWGALIFAFVKGKKRQKNITFPYSEKDLTRKLNLFSRQMENTREVLNEYKETGIYGYGAALMVPVLAYHLKSDLAFLKGIIDDDMEKDGLRYSNLSLKISHAGKIRDLQNFTIFITAVDNVKPIMTKLLSNRPRQIVFPFHAI
jgi:SAM-dependent methyltransferase